MVLYGIEKNHFTGSVALVTGGASDIGRALYRALAARGAAVVVGEIDGPGAAATAAMIAAAGGTAAHRGSKW
ncbi:MAG: hypothetical protein JXA20_14345 [Spirochaetes bacterium]|nr:hypothetical protein [Spirochaetota bacterium]